MSLKIKELPIGERPYEKLELFGEKTLSNAELLAIIIKSGTRNETSVEIAQRILNLNTNSNKDDLNFLRELSIEEFMKINGIGKVKAIQLKAVCELSIRMTKPTDYKQIIIKEPNDIAKILIPELRFLKKEVFKVVILNTKNMIMKIIDIAIGGTNFVNFQIKDILAEVLKTGGSKMIVAHNHPSGDPTPSKADIDITDKIYDAANLIGIELLDHVVIGNLNYTSIFTQKLKEKETKVKGHSLK